MAKKSDTDGFLNPRGEFTLLESFWEKLKEVLQVSFEQVLPIIFEKIAPQYWHDTRVLSLSEIRVNQEIEVPEGATWLLPISLDGIAQVRFDSPTGTLYDLSEYQPIKVDFDKFYLTNEAQSGKNLEFLVGKGDFEFPQQAIGGSRRTVLVQIDQTLGAPGPAVATWTSSTFDVLNYGRVTLLGQAAQGSSANGVRIQQSIDGTNWDYSTDYTVAANAPIAASVELIARYVRLSWESGTALVGNLRLALIARSMP